MSAKSVIAAIVFILLAFNYLSNVKAQDTFGPICDDVTVTCAPTQSPTAGPAPTNVLAPTQTPSPTPVPPTPTELPRAGTTENVYIMIITALTLLFAGTFVHFAFSPKKS